MEESCVDSIGSSETKSRERMKDELKSNTIFYYAGTNGTLHTGGEVTMYYTAKP